MVSIRRVRMRLWKPRYTIGNLMIAIVAIAIVLTALRPLAGALQTAYPTLAGMIHRFATIETGVALSCILAGAFVTVKMMSWDESTS